MSSTLTNVNVSSLVASYYSADILALVFRGTGEGGSSINESQFYVPGYE